MMIRFTRRLSEDQEEKKRNIPKSMCISYYEVMSDPVAAKIGLHSSMQGADETGDEYIGLQDVGDRPRPTLALLKQMTPVFKLLYFIGAIPIKLDICGIDRYTGLNAVSFRRTIGPRNVLLITFVSLLLLRTILAVVFGAFFYAESGGGWISFASVNFVFGVFVIVVCIGLFFSRWHSIECCCRKITAVYKITPNQFRTLRRYNATFLCICVATQIIRVAVTLCYYYFCDRPKLQATSSYFPVILHFIDINTEDGFKLATVVCCITDLYWSSLVFIVQYTTLVFAAVCSLQGAQMDNFKRKLEKISREAGRQPYRLKNWHALKKAFTAHTKLRETTSMIDNCFSDYLFGYMTYLISSIVDMLNLFLLYLCTAGQYVQPDTTVILVLYTFGPAYQLLLIIGCCSSIHEKGAAISDALDRLVSNAYQPDMGPHAPSTRTYPGMIDLMLFLQKVQQSPMTITCNRFFPITRSVLLSLFLGAVTYLVTLYQLQTN